jgi:hypothetical protein
MTVDVDTHQRDAKRPQEKSPAQVYSTEVFKSLDALVEARIDEIITANGGK